MDAIAVRYIISLPDTDDGVVLPWVTQVQRQLAAAVTVTPTIGDIVIERWGQRLGSIIVQGEVGYLAQPNDKGEWVSHSTVSLLKQALALCDSAIAADGPGYLRLWALDEGEVYLVVPERWILPRVPYNRQGMSWQLHFTLIGREKFERKPLIIPARERAKKGWVASVSETIDKARAALGQVKQWLGEIQAYIQAIEYLISRVEDALRDLQDIGRQLSDLFHAPARLYRRLAGMLMNQADFWYSYAKNLKRFFFDDKFGFSGAGDIWSLDRYSPGSIPRPVSETDYDVATGAPLSGFSSVTIQGAYQLQQALAMEQGPSIFHIVREGETIEQIAIRYFGTAQAASWILRLNEVEQIMPGMTLLITTQKPKTRDGILGLTPQEGPLEAISEMPLVPQIAEQVLYGVDFALGDGELCVSETGDIAMISGRNVLLQDILIGLKTRRGENTLWPDFGITVGIGELGTVTRIARLSQSIVEYVKGDDRIVAIQNIRVQDEGNGVIVSFIAEARGGQKMTISEVI